MNDSASHKSSIVVPVIRLISDAFEKDGMIPVEYTCNGANVSPRLSWDSVGKARAYALICDDPDAPMGTWVHWVVYNIPGSATSLQKNIPSSSPLADGTMQGENDFGKIGYGGPCPPGGTHRYFFKLYALDTTLSFPADKPVTKAVLNKAIRGHLVGYGQLVGRYTR